MGYLIDPLRGRTGTLSAALIIGLAWGAWHIVPFYTMGRSFGWIGAQVLASILMRVIIVWLYDKANKSVFIAIVFHTFINVATSIIPVAGSAYNPAITATILFIIVAGFGSYRYVVNRRVLAK
jgi:membrane protease YdiL (CAAX protease family)